MVQPDGREMQAAFIGVLWKREIPDCSIPGLLASQQNRFSDLLLKDSNFIWLNISYTLLNA